MGVRLAGSDYFYAAAGLALLYWAWKLTRAGESVIGAARDFWGALTFDERSLGDPVTLTEGALLSRDEYIRLGYMTPDGRITSSGEAYIAQQRARMGI